MKAILNAKIKRRESFRPFAPSVLEEAVAEWFEEDDDVPFMMQVFQIREDKRPLIPAVTHVDGSGRLQTVHRAHQSALLPPDRELSRPDRRADGAQHLVQRERAGGLQPEEALDCFLRTKMDLLVLGDITVSRREGAAA